MEEENHKMAKTTSQLDPAQALSLQNLIAKNEKQLEWIYYAYIDQFNGSHITNKNEFISFLRNYKIWREQMLKVLPVIMDHIRAEQNKYPNFADEVRTRLTAAGRMNGSNVNHILDLLPNAEEIFLLRPDGILGDVESRVHQLNAGLDLYLEIFGAEETKTTTGTATASGIAVAGSSTVSGRETATGGAFSAGNSVKTVRETEVFVVDKNKTLLFDRNIPPNSRGIIGDGPVKVNNQLWYRIQFEDHSRGWVNELDLTNANPPPTASSSGTSTSTSFKFKIGDLVKTNRKGVIIHLDDESTTSYSKKMSGQIVNAPRTVKEDVYWEVKFENGIKGWVREDLLKTESSFQFPSIPNPFKRKATATPQPPPIPKASARTSRLTGTGPRMRINLMPTPPPKKPWWKVW